MESLSHININHMKYITLALLFIVIFYGFHNLSKTDLITPTTSYFKNELPIYSVDTDKPVVALTFDSAWGDEDLKDILAILKKHNAPATFFVTGEWAQKYPDAIRLIDENGHEVANHGNSHKHMPQLSKEDMAKVISYMT